MMQHCQQVFAELNAGGVSVGGGGVPRTMIAGPGQQQVPQQYPNYRSSSRSSNNRKTTKRPARRRRR